MVDQIVKTENQTSSTEEPNASVAPQGVEKPTGPAAAVEADIAETNREAALESSKTSRDELMDKILFAALAKYENGINELYLDWGGTSRNYAKEIATEVLNKIPKDFPEKYKNVKEEWMEKWISAFTAQLKENDPVGDLDNDDVLLAREEAFNLVPEFDTWLKQTYPAIAIEIETTLREKTEAEKKAQEEAAKAKEAQEKAAAFTTENTKPIATLQDRVLVLTKSVEKFAGLAAVFAPLAAALENAKTEEELKAVEAQVIEAEKSPWVNELTTLNTSIATLETRTQQIATSLKIETLYAADIEKIKQSMSALASPEGIPALTAQRDALELRVKAGERIAEAINAHPETVTNEQRKEITDILEKETPSEETIVAFEKKINEPIAAEDKELDAAVDAANMTMADKLAAQAEKMENGSMKSLLKSVLEFMKSIGSMIAGLSFFPAAQEMAKNFYTTQELIDSGDKSVIFKKNSMKVLIKTFGLPIELAKKLANPKFTVGEIIQGCDSKRGEIDPDGTYKTQLDSLSAQLKSRSESNAAVKGQPFIAVLGAKEAKSTFKQVVAEAPAEPVVVAAAPEKPVTPTEPTAPTEPTTATEPLTPTPAAPTAPATPTVAPATPAAPTDAPAVAAAKPASAPAAAAAPETPATPATPTVPETPATPTAAAAPATPPATEAKSG